MLIVFVHPDVRHLSIGNGLQDLFASVGPSQDVANIIPIAFLEFGWQHRYPHGLGNATKNSGRELASIFASPVPVRYKNDFDTDKEPGELRS